MLLVNGPAVWIGERLSRVLPQKTIHYVSAGIFIIFGIVTIAVAMLSRE